MVVDRRALLVVVSLTIFAVASPSLAEGWSRFRGPNGSGVSTGPALPVDLGREENLAWTADVPFGRSTPVVAGERIFLTAAEDGRFSTLAFERDSGSLLWKRSVERARTVDMYHDQDSATPSPVTDGENVYVFFQEAGLLSYDSAGQERWRMPLGPFRNFYGMVGSPVIAGDRLFLVCDQAIGSFLLALDKNSGEVLWREERPGRQESYTTPVLYPDGEAPTALLVFGSGHLEAYDLASGEIHWSVSGLPVGPVASPVLSGDMVFVAGPDHASEPLTPFADLTEKYDANGDGALARSEVEETGYYNHFGFLDVDGSGELTAQDWDTLGSVMTATGWGVFGIRIPTDGGTPEIAWNYRKAVPYMPTPIVLDDVLYTVDAGKVTSLDVDSGEVLHQGRLPKGSEHYASPVVAGGRMYFASLAGAITVIGGGLQWEIVANSPLEEAIYASPVIDDDLLLVRTEKTLYGFAEPPAGESEVEEPAKP